MMRLRVRMQPQCMYAAAVLYTFRESKLVRLKFSSSVNPSLLVCFELIPNNHHTQITLRSKTWKITIRFHENLRIYVYKLHIHLNRFVDFFYPNTSTVCLSAARSLQSLWTTWCLCGCFPQVCSACPSTSLTAWQGNGTWEEASASSGWLWTISSAQLQCLTLFLSAMTVSCQLLKL